MGVSSLHHARGNHIGACAFGRMDRVFSRLKAAPSRLLWWLLRLRRSLWVRATFIAMLAFGAAAVAPFLGRYIPENLSRDLGAEAVRPILTVLASSMLAVTTFSLSVMVSAHRAASQQVTPRTHRLLLSDSTTQNVLATFLGAFLFSLVSIVLLNGGAVTGRSVVVVFVATAVVILLVVVAILRWIEHLSRLGSMLETTRVVEEAAGKAMSDRVAEPWLGARPADLAPGSLPHEVLAGRTGYVEHVDTTALMSLAREAGVDVLLTGLPGRFLGARDALVRCSAPLDEKTVRAAFEITDARSYDQDPRFGLIVLSEIGSRALSPGINDPGTAIDVIGRAQRVLELWQAPGQPETDEACRLFVPGLDPADLVEDALGAIARDGAGLVEVGLRLQSVLSALSRHDDPRMAQAARDMAIRALDHAREALRLPSDVERLAAVCSGSAPRSMAGQG